MFYYIFEIRYKDIVVYNLGVLHILGPKIRQKKIKIFAKILSNMKSLFIIFCAKMC